MIDHEKYKLRGGGVVEDSPDRLVLEEGASRWIAGFLLLVPIGGVAIGELDLNRPFDFFGTPLDARWVVGLFSMAMLWLLFERDRLVFDRAAGTVRRSVRLNRLRGFERPLSEIERVEIKERTSSQYGHESTDYRALLHLRGGKRVSLCMSHDEGFVRRLAGRVESFR